MPFSFSYAQSPLNTLTFQQIEKKVKLCLWYLYKVYFCYHSNYQQLHSLSLWELVVHMKVFGLTFHANPWRKLWPSLWLIMKSFAYCFILLKSKNQPTNEKTPLFISLTISIHLCDSLEVFLWMSKYPFISTLYSPHFKNHLLTTSANGIEKLKWQISCPDEIHHVGRERGKC